MSFISDFFSNSAQKAEFLVYENQVLKPDPTQSSTKPNIAIRFTACTNFKYEKDLKLAHEPLENGLFASDSLQIDPYIISMTCLANPVFLSPFETNSSLRAQIGLVEQKINEYQTNTTLLTLLQERPFFRQYGNIKIFHVDYEINQDTFIMRANLKFQEIRMVDNNVGKGLSGDQVNNPTYQQSVDNGNQNAQVPDSPDVQENAA